MTHIEPSLRSSGTSMFNVEQIRSDFPILKLKIDDKQLVYFDNAASSQMPKAVMDRMLRYQTMEHANINRAVHYLSETATAEYEKSRHKLKNFINANEDGWRIRYYDVLFDIKPTEERIRHICLNYAEGLEWTLKYYSMCG